MTATGSDERTVATGTDEATAVHGAHWFTVAYLVVGALNYGYALVLTRLLDAAAYARFAAGQGLLLSAATVATVSVPWVLAQAWARARTSAERADAVGFAIVIGTGGGVLAGAAVAAVALQFAGPATAVAVAAGTLLIYGTTVSVGALQGAERMRTLATLTVGEVLLKTVAGLLLVTVAGLSDAGALAAFGIGMLPLLFWWPSARRGSGRSWLRAAANRELWRRALGIARLQGLVSLLMVSDLVLVAVLATDRAAAASYQAGVVLARVPVFISSAVSMAFFPALSRRRAGTPLAASAVRMYVVVTLPIVAVLATVPGSLVSALFPADYFLLAACLRFTAIAGFAIGGVNLLVTLSQATDDYRSARWQAAGVLAYVLALLAGWRADGVLGVAVGAACGSALALAVLVHRMLRLHGRAALARPPLAEPLLLAGLLTLLHPHPGLWLAAALAVGARAALRFLRRPPAAPANPGLPPPGTEMRPSPVRQPASRHGAEQPLHVLTEAVWRGRPLPADDDTLREALVLARRNQVEGRLARAYPRQLAPVEAEVAAATGLFRRNLYEVTGRLRDAGIPGVLIKADLSGDYVYGNFDLVVRERQWQAAQAALAGWYARRSVYWLERSSKVLLEPPSGPAAHLHKAVSWFGVPVVPTERLIERSASRDGRPWLVPVPPDELRIWLAHALFQNLSLDLSELIAVRGLLRPDVVSEALREAGREGWAAAAHTVLAAAREAIDRLDAGAPVRLPLPLPVAASAQEAAQHPLHLLRETGTRAAVRDAALRLPLVVAKKRRLALS
jgi:O-antigen/teichoic acid export membrane protein